MRDNHRQKYFFFNKKKNVDKSVIKNGEKLYNRKKKNLHTKPLKNQQSYFTRHRKWKTASLEKHFT